MLDITTLKPKRIVAHKCRPPLLLCIIIVLTLSSIPTAHLASISATAHPDHYEFLPLVTSLKVCNDAHGPFEPINTGVSLVPTNYSGPSCQFVAATKDDGVTPSFDFSMMPPKGQYFSPLYLVPVTHRFGNASSESPLARGRNETIVHLILYGGYTMYRQTSLSIVVMDCASKHLRKTFADDDKTLLDDVMPIVEAPRGRTGWRGIRYEVVQKKDVGDIYDNGSGRQVRQQREDGAVSQASFEYMKNTSMELQSTPKPWEKGQPPPGSSTPRAPDIHCVPGSTDVHFSPTDSLFSCVGTTGEFAIGGSTFSRTTGGVVGRGLSCVIGEFSDHWRGVDGLVGFSHFISYSPIANAVDETAIFEPKKEMVYENDTESGDSGWFNILKNDKIEGKRILVMDLRLPHETSYLHFGGMPPSWGDPEVIWSQPKGTHFVNEHVFIIYKLTLCGVNLFEGGSSSWRAIITPEAPCLSLPIDFFEMFKAWAPTHCESSVDAEYIEVCYFDRNAGLAPSLHFYNGEISINGENDENDDVGNKPSMISLNMDGVCFAGSKGVLTDRASTYTPLIKFGSQVLRQFAVIFDYAELRVGFVPRERITPDDEEGTKAKNTKKENESGATSFGKRSSYSFPPNTTMDCYPRKVCIGAQTFDRPSNTCKDPDCGAYYFQHVDNKTKTCRLSAQFQVAVAVFTVIFIATELAFFQIYRYVTSGVEANFENTEVEQLLEQATAGQQ